MFITAVFVIAPNWKQPRCPSTDEWLNQLWYIHITGYYSVMKRIELLIPAKNLDESQGKYVE